MGGGHVMRCLALANSLEDSGCSIRFAVTAETLGMMPTLSSRPVIIVKSPTDARQLTEAVPEGCDLLIVDQYAWDASLEEQCRPWAKKIMVIDDLADRRHDCDILLDQTYGRDPSDYADLVPTGCDVLAGPHYALLRPEFTEARPRALRRREPVKFQRILVSVGLTDPMDVTSTILDGIIESGLRLQTDVVLGSSATRLANVREKVSRHADIITVHADTPRMAELMIDADFAFGAAGSTSWERCCLGLPTAFVVVASNQEKTARELAEAGAAVNLGPFSQLTASVIASTLLKLRRDAGILQNMSKNAAKICDGRGAPRVAARYCEAALVSDTDV